MDHAHHHHHHHGPTPKPTTTATTTTTADHAHNHHQHMHHGEHEAHPTYDVITQAVTSLVSTVMSTVMPSMHDHDGHDMHAGHEVHVSHDMHGDHSSHAEGDTSHSGHGGHGGHGDHGGSHAGHGGAHGGHDGHHPTYFHTKYDMSVLFEEWTIDTKTGIFLVFLFTAILAVCYQGIKWVRTYLHNHYRDRKHSWKSKEHVLQSVLYGAEFFVSYILMLVVMTYNLWVLVITIVGLGLGYFFFGLHQNTNCARDCPNVTVLVDERNRNYDKNPSASELVPLGEGIEVCEGCCGSDLQTKTTSEFKTVRETDILT